MGCTRTRNSLREGDVIAAGADEELDSLRAMRDNAGEFLVNLEAREKSAQAYRRFALNTTASQATTSKFPVRPLNEFLPTTDVVRHSRTSSVSSHRNLKLLKTKHFRLKNVLWLVKKNSGMRFSIASRSLSNRFWTPQRPLRAPMLFFPLPSMPKLLTG